MVTDVVAAMARHGVRVREVRVRPCRAVNATAPLRGRMTVTEGFLQAPRWRQAAILAHEAGHVRLRHTPRCVVLAAALEAALAAVRYALAPVVLRGPVVFAAATAAVLVGEAGVWAAVSALMRRHEVEADRWAVGPGGVAAADYVRHLALLSPRAPGRWWDRLLATHPAPQARAAALRAGARRAA
jgi:Zn-dependent protease with chaperone function